MSTPPVPPPVSWKPSRKVISAFITASVLALGGISALASTHSLTLLSGSLAVLGPYATVATAYLVPPPG